MPRELVESELFGHEKGAFTGAIQQKKGRFELADGGSLFLDEIGELSLEAQAKLLRVLREHEIARVGGTQSIRVDVRVIAATNHELADGTLEEMERAHILAVLDNTSGVIAGASGAASILNMHPSTLHSRMR